MITTLALVMFTCNVDSNTGLERCDYKIESTYSNENVIRNDIINCLSILEGEPDVITNNQNSFSFRACYITGEVISKPGLAYLSNVEDPSDSFMVEVKEVDNLSISLQK